MKSRKKVTHKRVKRRKSSIFRSRGKMGLIYMLLLVIIFGGLLLSNGLFPDKSIITPAEDKYPAELVTNTPGPDRANLQLDTLRFRRCSDTAAIDFLIDRSGSMRYGNKMSNVQSALRIFSDKLSDHSVLGIQSFSDPQNPQRVDVPISYYRDIKNNIKSKISALYPNGATYMRDAFEMTRDELFAALDAKDANGNKKFPDKYTFNLIFISDGVPETFECGRNTNPPLPTCSADNQNPTIDPNIAEQIKDRGIKIFTIAYLYTGDDPYNNSLISLMQNIASKDDEGRPYFYKAPIGDQLHDILKQITNRICNDI